MTQTLNSETGVGWVEPHSGEAQQRGIVLVCGIVMLGFAVLNPTYNCNKLFHGPAQHGQQQEISA